MNKTHLESDSLFTAFHDKDLFKELLKDRTFTDYLNIFLSLPVFPVRLVYIQYIGKFVIETEQPILNDFRTTNEQVSEWIREKRGELFLGTFICNEFRLASMLTKLPITLKIDSLDGEDEKITKLKLKCFGTAVAMQHFKSYLNGTIGENIIQLWLDANIFLHKTSVSCKQYMKDIELKYLVDGAKFELNLSLRKRIKHLLYVIRAKRDKNGTALDKSSLLGLQTMVEESLQNYWIPQYLNHRAKILGIVYCRWNKIFQHTDIKSKSGIGDLVKMKGQQNEERFEMVLDQEQIKNTFRDDSNNCSERLVLPRVSGRRGNKTKVLNEKSDKTLRLLRSIQEVDKSNSTEKVILSKIEDPTNSNKTFANDLLKKSHKELNLLIVEKAVQNRKIKNLSINEILGNFFKKNKESSSVQINKNEEMLIKKDDSLFQSLLSALATDSIAGQPMLKHFQKTDNKQAESNLMFWTKTHDVLNDYLKDQSLNKQEEFDSLIQTYLSKASEYKTSLSRSVKTELCYLLSNGTGIEKLIDATTSIAKDLFTDWKRYTEYDAEMLKKDLYKNIDLLPTKEDITPIQDGRQIPKRNYKRMWKSMQLAISICNLQHLEFTQKNIEIDYDTESETSSDEDNEELSDSELGYDNQDFDNNTRSYIYSSSMRINTSPKKPSKRKRNQSMPSHDKKKQNLNDKNILEKRKSLKFEVKNTSKSTTDILCPKSFQDIFKDPAKFEHFKTFLIRQKAEAGLLFSAALEAKIQKSRINQQNRIIRRFIHTKAIPKDARTFIENATEKPVHSGQVSSLKALEEKWYAQYLSTFTPNVFCFLPDLIKRRSMREKNRHLWRMFANNLIRFWRVIKQPELSNKFVSFLKMEHRLNFERSNRGHNLNHGLPPRVTINNDKQIHTERLVADVAFLLEVMKYKYFFDALSVDEIAKSSGVEQDQLLIINKAKTITDCFIDSQVPPQVQININKNQAEKIKLLVRKGIITRGLFHEVFLIILSILLYYWKKYCYYRESAYKRKLVTRNCIDRSAYVIAAQKTLNKGKVKKTVLTQIEEDCYSKLLFSIQLGLRLGMPRSLFKKKSITVMKLDTINDTNVIEEKSQTH